MTLPSLPNDFLPEDDTTWSSEARRLADFLCRVDQHFGEEATIKVYGSAAVAFYTAATSQSGYMTEDIDVGDPGSLPALQNATELAKQKGPEIDFHFRPPGLWVAAGDWPNSCVDVSRKLGTSSLSVELMHPIDLIISKMVRWNERDAEDISLIRDTFCIDVGTFARRLNQAVEDSMLTDWDKEALVEILEELFFEDNEVEIARKAAPALYM